MFDEERIMRRVGIENFAEELRSETKSWNRKKRWNLVVFSEIQETLQKNRDRSTPKSVICACLGA